MGQLILVLGGARSGKSAFAQRLAAERGGEGVVYVATAEAGDDEMAQRIERHRRGRPAGWRTLEQPRDVAAAIRREAGEAPVVLVDCLTLLVSNRLVEAADPFEPAVEAAVMAEVQGLVACADERAGALIVVSNEVGLGLVPDNPLGRAFRDIVGRANQVLARHADAVYFMVAGLPMRLTRPVP